MVAADLRRQVKCGHASTAAAWGEQSGRAAEVSPREGEGRAKGGRAVQSTASSAGPQRGRDLLGEWGQQVERKEAVHERREGWRTRLRHAGSGASRTVVWVPAPVRGSPAPTGRPLPGAPGRCGSSCLQGSGSSASEAVAGRSTSAARRLRRAAAAGRMGCKRPQSAEVRGDQPFELRERGQPRQSILAATKDSTTIEDAPGFREA